jgi:hypothetical protein
VAYSEYCVNFLVVWCNICNECKRAQASPYVIWEEEENKCKCSEVPEETVSANCPTIGSRLFLGLVEGSE